MGVSAANTANNLLYIVVSGMLGIMGVSGFFGKINISNLDIMLDFPEEIYVEEPFLLKIKIKNKKIVPSLAVKIKIHPKDASVAIIEPHKEREIIISLIAPKRGKNEIRRIEISSPFPFAFFVRSRSIPCNFSYIAFPKPIKCPYHAAEPEKEGDSTQTIFKGINGDFIGLREYQPQDPIKFIHWKVSAKRGKFIVREFSSQEKESLFIEISKLPGDIETKLSCASYIVNLAYKKGMAVGLKIKHKVIPPKRGKAHKLLILKELALFES